MSADLIFRKAKRRDVEQIRRLHEEWFPVRYGNDFYEAIAADEDEECCNYNDGSLRSFQSPFSKTGKSRKYTFSVVAVMDSMSIDLDDIKELCELEEGTSSVRSDVNIDTVEVGKGEEIVGCVVSTLLSSDKNRMIHDLLVKDKHKYPEVAYIMTLGTHAQYRRCGVGQRLVETCIKQAMSNSKCGAIYLHVITYNDAAIYFYERLGFYRITVIEGYYVIDNEKYDCYVYAKFINGNGYHEGLSRWLWVQISQVFYSFISVITRKAQKVYREQTVA